MRLIVPALLISALFLTGCATTPQPPRQPQAAHTVPIFFESTPIGAELYIDGKLVGSTNVSYRLGVGDHTVEIRRAGFEPWRRELTVTAGNPTRLIANLVKTGS